MTFKYLPANLPTCQPRDKGNEFNHPFLEGREMRLQYACILVRRSGSHITNSNKNQYKSLLVTIPSNTKFTPLLISLSHSKQFIFYFKCSFGKEYSGHISVFYRVIQNEWQLWFDTVWDWKQNWWTQHHKKVFWPFANMDVQIYKT